MSKNIFGSYNTGIVSATGTPYISSDLIVENDTGVTLSSALDTLQAGTFSGNLTMGDTSSDSITVNAGTTSYVNNETINLKNSSSAGLIVKATSGSTFITLDTNSTGILNLHGTTDSTSSVSGGVIISGGVGINKKLYVGDTIVAAGAISGTTITGTGALTVGANSITCGAINTSGITTSTNATDSTSYSTGSVIISGGVGISKHMYLNGGLYLSTSGGTPSVLDYCETGVSFSVLFKSTVGGGTTNTITVKLSRVGNIVNMIVPNMSIDVNGGYIISDATTYLPARFQPLNTYTDFTCHTVNLGVYQDTGIFTVGSTGQILIYKAQGGSIYFGVGAGSGITNVSSFTWQV